MGFDEEDPYDLGEEYRAFREKENKDSYSLPAKDWMALASIGSCIVSLAVGMNKGFNDAKGIASGLETVIAWSVIATAIHGASSFYAGGTINTSQDPLMRKLQGWNWSKEDARKGLAKGTGLGSIASLGLAGLGYAIGQMFGKIGK